MASLALKGVIGKRHGMKLGMLPYDSPPLVLIQNCVIVISNLFLLRKDYQP